jgi:transcription-repair coupling factor (superfamily II helicase)
MALIVPIPGVWSASQVVRLSSCPCRVWGLFNIHGGGLVWVPNAIYTQTQTQTQNSLGLSNSISTKTKSSKRREAAAEAESDAISILNERIRREQRKKSSPRTAMESEEADKYIELVKEQQQRGLQKLKGDVSYKVDPYTLRSGDYVVHKKVGIGRFVGIKFDIPNSNSNSNSGSMDPIEYVFIEYADGMAKLPVKQASRLLYRYNL